MWTKRILKAAVVLGVLAGAACSGPSYLVDENGEAIAPADTVSVPDSL